MVSLHSHQTKRLHCLFDTSNCIMYKVQKKETGLYEDFKRFCGCSNFTVTAYSLFLLNRGKQEESVGFDISGGAKHIS